MRIRLFLLFIVATSFIFVQAQTTKVQYGQQTWFDYLNQNRYTKEWGSWAGVQLKLTDGYYKSFYASESSLGVTYYTKNNLKLVGAFTYINQVHSPGTPYHLNEYRPWEMVQVNTEADHSKTLQWLRLEERFKQTAFNDAPSSNYDLTYRLRYYILKQFPLTKHKYQKGSLSFIASDEIYFNAGKNIVYNTFDQNRLSLGLYYFLNKDNILQVGYTNVFQQLNAKNSYSNMDVIRCSIFNNIDFRN